MAKDEKKLAGLHEYCAASKVAEALKTQDIHDMGMITGALGALANAKGSRAVNYDKQVAKEAERYSDILVGKKEGVLTSKDAERIANLVNSFIKPPSR